MSVNGGVSSMTSSLTFSRPVHSTLLYDSASVDIGYSPMKVRNHS
jgi:hypothetical protein